MSVPHRTLVKQQDYEVLSFILEGKKDYNEI